MVVAVLVHVQRPRVFIPLVESYAHPDDVLRLVKVVIEPAPVVVVIVEAVSLTRPARAGIEIVVSSVLGRAAVRAATVPGRPCVVPRSEHIYGGPLACIDECCGGCGKRSTRKNMTRVKGH